MNKIEIYSRKEKEKLIHIVFKFNDGISEEVVRNEITPTNTFLQAMCFQIPANQEFKAHKHNRIERSSNITHEAFLILKGSIELSIFDVDNTFLDKFILREGDCSIIIEGGHSFKSLEDTILYEFKNGPYFGREKDKEFIT